MTNELEKQFFDTFGIEPHEVYPPQDELFGTREEMIEFFEEVYPQITDRILLELICILNNYGCTSFAGNFEQLKNEVLSNSIMCCENTDDYIFQHKVRILFEEG